MMTAPIPSWLAIVLFGIGLCFEKSVAASSRDRVSFDFGWKHRTGLTQWAKPDDPAIIDPDPGLHPPEVHSDYDTSDWIDVALPHDALIGSKPSTTACPHGCSGHSYLPRPVLWYRKTFSLPSDWTSADNHSSMIWLHFEGSFRNTTIWINEEYITNHIAGYLPFRVRLDNITSVMMGSKEKKNVITVYVDPNNGDLGGPAKGSGWWYEGGGLYRHVTLERTPSKIFVEQDGLFAHSHIKFAAEDNVGTATSANVTITASIYNGKKNDKEQDPQPICVKFRAYNYTASSSDESVATSMTKPISIAPETTTHVRDVIVISNPQLWSLQTPFQYKIQAIVNDCNNDSAAVIYDALTVLHGIRHLRYDANNGFFLNQQHFKIRGFCDHDTFAVVGMAIPDRINLFRAQASRAIGGNGRRMSHNPPSSSLLQIYDVLGMVVMDENRLFDNKTDVYAENMKRLVKRDRNHPSVVIWSFCNEMDCENHKEAGPSFQKICDEYDGTRPTLANMFSYNNILSNTIDVQGFSHRDREHLNQCHEAMPTKPIFMSECCSCNTMRDEDIGVETMKDNPHDNSTQMTFNARCLERVVNASDGVEYAVGTMVWTLMDYYGEPPVGPEEVSSTYGQYDLGGFPKASAYWFYMQWLLFVPDGSIDKTVVPTDGTYQVHIVESWESPDSWEETKGNTTRTIHVYSNAPRIQLKVNGKPADVPKTIKPMREGPGAYAEFEKVPWEAGIVEAIAMDMDGKRVLATTSRRTTSTTTTTGTTTAHVRSSSPSLQRNNNQKLILSLDSPSEHTGTGSSLLLDGQDAALLRASIVNNDSEVVHFAQNNITFTVVSGPGRIQGTTNGDPRSCQPNNVPWHSAYHGLVRAVVRVTSIAGRSKYERGLLQEVDHDGPMSRRIGGPLVGDFMDDSDIVVEARSDGLDSVQITIPTTTDEAKESVLAVAAAAQKGTELLHFLDKHRVDGGKGQEQQDNGMSPTLPLAWPSGQTKQE